MPAPRESLEPDPGPLDGLGDHRRDWDELASSDALWAILSDPDKRHGRWDEDDFFATGPPEMRRVMDQAKILGVPRGHDAALDFGCGVGRVTRAMTSFFDRCVGVDVSSVMIENARRLHDGIDGVEFVHNDRSDLARFADDSFDLVYSYIVLQHLPTTELIEGYLREFVRILRPAGLIAFQLPDAIRLRHRLQPRRRVYSVLRRAGVPASALGSRLGLHPIRMTAVPERRVREVLEEAGATVLETTYHMDGPFSNVTYWATVGSQPRGT